MKKFYRTSQKGPRRRDGFNSKPLSAVFSFASGVGQWHVWRLHWLALFWKCLISASCLPLSLSVKRSILRLGFSDIELVRSVLRKIVFYIIWTCICGIFKWVKKKNSRYFFSHVVCFFFFFWKIAALEKLMSQINE